MIRNEIRSLIKQAEAITPWPTPDEMEPRFLRDPRLSWASPSLKGPLAWFMQRMYKVCYKPLDVEIEGGLVEHQLFYQRYVEYTTQPNHEQAVSLIFELVEIYRKHLPPFAQNYNPGDTTNLTVEITPLLIDQAALARALTSEIRYHSHGFFRDITERMEGNQEDSGSNKKRRTDQTTTSWT